MRATNLLLLRFAIAALRRVAPPALALLLSAGVAAAAGGGAGSRRIAEVLRPSVLRGANGGSQSIAGLRGEVVVVNFWASWCPPCRHELAGLDALHAQLAGHGGRVLAVSIDVDPANVKRFVRAQKLRLPVYLDGPDGLARRLDLDHIPYTIVLDRRGEVAFTTSAADANGIAELGAVTRRLLAEAPAPALTTTQEGGTR